MWQSNEQGCFALRVAHHGTDGMHLISAIGSPTLIKVISGPPAASMCWVESLQDTSDLADPFFSVRQESIMFNQSVHVYIYL